MISSKDLIKKIANETKPKQEIKEEKQKLVIFLLDNEEYAADIKYVQEIVRLPEVTFVPNVPNFITGIFNLRGKIIVVVDLEKKFNLVRETINNKKIVMISEIEKNNYGIIVDKVKEIIDVPIRLIQPAPDLLSPKIKKDYFLGVVPIAPEKEEKDISSNQKSRLIIIIDLKKMLEEKELLGLNKTVEDAINK